ncbi:hypothetical protein SUGI_0376110 [Cryptomeria japonica]|uniref:DELLA protein GAIP-like n=1 Tax=Cryptomeria japonica TaxID=3369 RepID=UPI0024089F69|nr:DELLA protein GAIP-like [Cryptomeria japonica]GLJ20657.1 hypothetical protein SUGI_0376110 [Cryptomeria japonica]
MPQYSPILGYQKFSFSEIYQADETEQNNGTLGKLDEVSVPLNFFTELPIKFGSEMPTNKTGLSSEEIIKLAGTRYIRGFAYDGFESCFVTPALASEDQKGLELAHLLFASAELISNKQYDQASRLLMQCQKFSSQCGNPIQRIGYYFSGALLQRIERQISEKSNKLPKEAFDFAYNIDNGCDKNEIYSTVAFYARAVPFVKLVQFSSVQAIIEAVGNARKIHVIDLGIRTGCQWTVLIQSLALRAPSSPLELLKITAVGMNGQEMKNSGGRLEEFAKSSAIPFSYKMVKVSDMEEIHEGLFDVKPGEAVAVYVPSVFRTLLYKPVLLQSVVDVVKKLKPRIMVSTEIEADHNSPCFDKRFIEVLFSCSTWFDSYDAILPDRDDVKRVKFEEAFCGSQIRNMIACEGNDRRVRHVRTDVWRKFFGHAGLTEMAFSHQVWYQARLLLRQFPHAECYTLEANGSAIMVGWKGTPLQAISAWTCC